MKWSRDKPTKPGWYWWRNQSSYEPKLVDVTIDGRGLLKSGPPANFREVGARVGITGEEWAGPVEVLDEDR